MYFYLYYLYNSNNKSKLERAPLTTVRTLHNMRPPPPFPYSFFPPKVPQQGTFFYLDRC